MIRWRFWKSTLMVIGDRLGANQGSEEVLATWASLGRGDGVQRTELQGLRKDSVRNR